ncbi:Mtrnr2-like [Mus musculus]|uniref:Mt-Rnr2 like 7 n=1 Tax=Mus musculus TaxID=10090 RepID=J3QJY3_MOUSE|nr:Mtrnr2-like [Mus musculus]|eukprot:NP_001177661.1 Mtrnr2-like [Mus musculus]
MAKGGFNCLLFLISEIDLSVKRLKYNNKTRRPLVFCT